MADRGKGDVGGGVVAKMDPLRALQIGEEQRSQRREPRVRRGRLTMWVGAAALGAVVIATAAWLGLRSKTVPVRVTTVYPASNASGALLTAGGYVRHPRVVNVVPRLSGIIATLRVSEGDVVHEGDLIATLDREEPEQQVAESRAELRATQARLAELEAGGRREEIASARAKVDALRLTAERLDREKARSKVLAEAGAVTAQAREAAENESLVANKTLESAQQDLALLSAGARPEIISAARATVDAARARLARATDILGRTEIRAPLSGRVLRKFLDVGAVVSFGLPYTEGYNTLGPGSPIVAIGQLDGLEAFADINQTDLGRLSLGEKVEVGADAFPGKTYSARVTRFSPRADRNKNTIEVTVRFDDPVPGEFAHDMSVKLSFLGDQATQSIRELLIPASAIVEQAGAKVVFVVENGHVRSRRILAGPPLPSQQVPIKDGLVAGDVVVITNPEALKDGMKVAPTSAP
jgi:HlyD family secretion protein